MSWLKDLFEQHHAAKSTRQIQRAIDRAASSTMRDELILVSQRQLRQTI